MEEKEKIKTHKIIMSNEKNGYYETDVFEGTLKECKSYLLEEKKIIEKDEGFEDIEMFEDSILTGYGGYGHFTYKIIKNNLDIKEKIKAIGKENNNQIFLTTSQLNEILESKMLSIGKYGVFVTL